MFDYSIKCENEDMSIGIDKDYILRVKESNNEITIEKEEGCESLKEGSCCDLVYSLHGYLVANDVDDQLSNIKHIGFETTDSCNLKCTYCIYGDFYNDYDERLNKSIDINKAKMLIDFLIKKVNSTANKSLINRIIISFYGGEPLLNISFIKEIVFYTSQIQNSHILFDYVMTTNAIYLKKYIDFFIEYNFNITVSLDGSEENNRHRKFHNEKETFNIVYNDLKYIQNVYSDYFEENIRFNTVLHNLNNVQDVFLFIYNEFNKIPHLSEVNPFGVKASMKKEFDHIIREKPYKKNEKYIEMRKIFDLDFSEFNQLQHFVFHYAGNTYYNYNDLLIKKEKINHLPTATCIPFSKRIFMTVNNKILPCERIGHQYSLGEVTEDGVKIDCEYIAEKYNDYYNYLRSQCEGCYSKKHCTQCVFDIHDLGKNSICEKMSDKKMFSKYLQENMDTLSENPHFYKRIMDEVMINK